MGRIVHEEIIRFWCPACGHKTAGIIVDGVRKCPTCKRKLWKCSRCEQLTFGTLRDEACCDKCRKKRA